MTEHTEGPEHSRFCKACGAPAADGKLCRHCGVELEIPEEASLIDDEGAAVRRDFEGRGTPSDGEARPQRKRTLRQLSHVRGFYGAGVALWTVSTAWAAWDSPGSRPMWTSVLLLVVFTGLLALTTVWLRRLKGAGAEGPARHAAPRSTVVPRITASRSTH